jgi:hypothetical protein
MHGTDDDPAAQQRHRCCVKYFFRSTRNAGKWKRMRETKRLLAYSRISGALRTLMHFDNGSGYWLVPVWNNMLGTRDCYEYDLWVYRENCEDSVALVDLRGGNKGNPESGANVWSITCFPSKCEYKKRKRDTDMPDIDVEKGTSWNDWITAAAHVIYLTL